MSNFSWLIVIRPDADWAGKRNTLDLRGFVEGSTGDGATSRILLKKEVDDSLIGAVVDLAFPRVPDGFIELMTLEGRTSNDPFPGRHDEVLVSFDEDRAVAVMVIRRLPQNRTGFAQSDDSIWEIILTARHIWDARHLVLGEVPRIRIHTLAELRVHPALGVLSAAA